MVIFHRHWNVYQRVILAVSPFSRGICHLPCTRRSSKPWFWTWPGGALVPYGALWCPMVPYGALVIHEPNSTPMRFKPSTSHHHFYKWFLNHSQMAGLWHCFFWMVLGQVGQRFTCDSQSALTRTGQWFSFTCAKRTSKTWGFSL